MFPEALEFGRSQTHGEHRCRIDMEANGKSTTADRNAFSAIACFAGGGLQLGHRKPGVHSAAELLDGQEAASTTLFGWCLRNGVSAGVNERPDRFQQPGLDASLG
jgi:hypothetical protein